MDPTRSGPNSRGNDDCGSDNLNDDDREVYAEALELQGLQELHGSLSTDSLALSTVTETSSSSSTGREIPVKNSIPNYPTKPVRPRSVSLDGTSTSSSSWWENEKKKRLVPLVNATRVKPAPIRRTGVLELARIEHEKRMEYMAKEWAIKRRILDVKLRAAEMKLEAYRWKAEYFELAAKRRFYLDNYD